MKKVENKPELTPLARGGLFKVVNVNGAAGKHIPEHHSTHETVVVVKKGSALLRLKQQEHVLKKDKFIIIAAGERHSLSIKEDFQALAIMPIDSTIEF